MSILKKLGIILLKVGEYAADALQMPFVSQLIKGVPGGAIIGTVMGDLTSVASILVTMETAFPSINGARTGSQKLSAASPLVGQVVLQWAQSNLPGHNKVKDASAFSQHVTAFTSSFADILNDFE